MTREIIIQPVLNGYVCVVGCQRVAFTDKQTMLGQLSEYLDKPDEVEQRYIERAVNKMGPAVPQPCRPTDCCESSAPTPSVAMGRGEERRPR